MNEVREYEYKIEVVTKEIDKLNMIIETKKR